MPGIPDGPPRDAAGAAVPEEAGGPLNGERLSMLEGAGGDSGLAAELVELFVDDVPPRLEQIRRAVDVGDAQTVVRTAHSLKGSASTLGADGMAEMCRQMEVCGRAVEWLQVQVLLESLETEFRRVKVALAEWVAAL